MDFGRRIKYRRQELHKSAEKVAEQIGVNKSTMYRYEKNQIKNFPAQLLIPLAKSLNVSNHEIMDWLAEEDTNE